MTSASTLRPILTSVLAIAVLLATSACSVSMRSSKQNAPTTPASAQTTSAGNTSTSATTSTPTGTPTGSGASPTVIRPHVGTEPGEGIPCPAGEVTISMSNLAPVMSGNCDTVTLKQTKVPLVGAKFDQVKTLVIQRPGGAMVNNVDKVKVAGTHDFKLFAETVGSVDIDQNCSGITVYYSGGRRPEFHDPGHRGKLYLGVPGWSANDPRLVIPPWPSNNPTQSNNPTGN